MRSKIRFTGTSFYALYPYLSKFKERIILRNEYSDETYEYIYKLLNGRYHDKVFWKNNPQVANAEFSGWIEPLFTMIKTFNEYKGTNYAEGVSASAYANYEESEELDLDDLNVKEDVNERTANRDSGSKNANTNTTFTINELINRESRINDYLVKKIDILFHTKIRLRRRENYEW